MSIVLGVDIGGTFTDAFAATKSGHLYSGKAQSTVPDYSRGVMDAVCTLAEAMGMTCAELLKQAEYLCHGTTVTLNALTTGDVAKVGWITTKGHRDSIYIMNVEGRYAGLRPDQIRDQLYTEKPAPLVPRDLVREVTERIDVNGEVVVPLAEAEVEQSIRDLVTDGIEILAVATLWSFLNPVHEQRIAEIARRIHPDLHVVLSSDVSPRIREYPRNVTTIMNAQVAPKLRGYLEPLDTALRESGFAGNLLVMQGSGGVVAAEDASRYAVTTIGSVLTGGLVGSQKLGSQLGHDNIISTDVGGTTFLVGLVAGGHPVFTNSIYLNQYMVNVPMAQVASIGSGGGTIAWVDEVGKLRLGPHSAGARPGPACYSQGGTEPTVTDANLALGILDSGYFLGGDQPLDVERAREAIKANIADPLGVELEAAAAAVYELQNSQTADLVRKSVLEAGYDPRDFVMYTFGGAGPIHCHAFGRDLGVREILVPLGPTAAVFSAYGLSSSDVILSAETSAPATYPVSARTVNEHLADLRAELEKRVGDQGIPYAQLSFRYEIDIRYAAQVYEVPTPVPPDVANDADVERVIAAFETKYASLFGEGTGYAEGGFQFITYRAFAIAELPMSPEMQPLPRRDCGSVQDAVKGTRSALLDTDLGWEKTTIYDYAALQATDVVKGPAIVEAPTTTVVVPPAGTGTVDEYGNLVLRDTRRKK